MNNYDGIVSIKLIPAFEKNNSIITIYLGRNKIREGSGLAISEIIAKSKSLKSLDLDTNLLSIEDIQLIIEALKINP
jgi:hypothetical protein